MRKTIRLCNRYKQKKVIKTVKVGQRPRGIIMSKDGKLVLICASDDDRVEVRDAETMKLKYYLPSGPDPELLFYHLKTTLFI